MTALTLFLIGYVEIENLKFLYCSMVIIWIGDLSYCYDVLFYLLLCLYQVCLR